MAEDTLDQTLAGQIADRSRQDEVAGDEQVEVPHKPHPIHHWRDFLGEILIIVVGVLIALGLGQLVDELHWQQKVSQAERNMRVELGRDRTAAAQYAILASCTDRFLDRMQADLLHQDRTDLSRLHALGEPFVTEPWTATAWDAAVASQVGDHMATDRFLNYAEAFRRADLMKEVQFRLRDHFAAAMVGRFALANGQGQAEALTASEELRRDITLARVITKDFIANTDALAITSNAAGETPHRKHADTCATILRTAAASGT
jgi:hypothetical protein